MNPLLEEMLHHLKTAAPPKKKHGILRQYQNTGWWKKSCTSWDGAKTP